MGSPATRHVRSQQPHREHQRKANTTIDKTAADEEDEQDDVDVTALHPVLQWDLDTVRWLVALRASSPFLETLVIATTSKYRTQDISLLLWLFFLVMLPELGLPYVWICIGNLLVVLLLQYAAQVMRPVDIDSTIDGIPSCTDPDTNGFPCVDSHMALVVLLPVIENSSSTVAQLLFTSLILYIGLSRLLLGARFVSQIVCSWLTGLTGIVLGNHGHVVVKSYRLTTSGYNTAAIIALLAFLMVVVGNWVESNESRLLGVPKTDFMDVLGNILGSDGATTTTSTSTPTTTGTARVRQMPGRHENHDDTRSDEHEELLGKKDSFYYLVRGMRTRSRAQPRR